MAPLQMGSSRLRTISIVNRSGRRAPSTLIRRALAAVFEQHNARDGEISVLLTDDLEIEALNRQFRSIDESTDVLSFPSEHPAILGDIAISVPYAQRQAALRKVGLDQEIAYLTIHGGLHLLGFDDESVQDRRVMMEQMCRAAVAAGLAPDPEWTSLLHEARK
jgi:probable rRNA maturation factor